MSRHYNCTHTCTECGTKASHRPLSGTACIWPEVWLCPDCELERLDAGKPTTNAHVVAFSEKEAELIYDAISWFLATYSCDSRHEPNRERDKALATLKGVFEEMFETAKGKK
jgi:hypothetical protein